MDTDLLLHLPLDEAHDSKLFDSSDNRRNGRLHQAAIVDDPDFGPCLELSGAADSFVELPPLAADVDFSAGLTIAAWVRLGAHDKPCCLLELGNGPQEEALMICAEPEGTGAHLAVEHYRSASMPVRAIVPSLLKPDDWVHVAVVIPPNGQTTLYLDGQAKGAAAGRLPRTLVRAKNYLGRSSQTDRAGFAGRIAGLRIYSRALAADEISWDMEEDRPARYRFRITHPLDFRLENDEAHPVLYMIDAPDGQELVLNVVNTSRHPLQFVQLPGDQASATNCHFELRFRPGTLAPDSLAKVALAKADDGWQIGTYAGPLPNEPDTIYLLRTKPGPLPATGLALRLANMVADSRHGTRTTLVEFRYSNLQIASGEPVSGSTEHNLDLINHRGKREIPLHVGFAGPNLVLNGRSSPDLRLRVTNILPKRDPFQAAGPSDTLTFDDDSHLLVSFDDQDGVDWALAAPERIGEINIQYAKGKVTKTSPLATRSAEGGPWLWTIPLKGISLGPREHIEIVCGNITASGPDGHTNLYLDYRSIPGYWDGRFVSVIEKGPLIHGGVQPSDKRYGYIGIGTATPEARLDIAHESGLAVRVEPAIGKSVYVGRSEDNSVQFDFNYGQAINSTASISFNIDSNNDDNNTRYVDFRSNGAGFAGGSSLMRILEDGRVGIGTTGPGARLSVVGGAHIGGTSDPGSANLQVDGRVGIGTARPNGTLQVGSAIRAEGDSDGQLIIGKNNSSGMRMFRVGMNKDFHLTIGDYGYESTVVDRPYLTIKWDDGKVGIGTGATAPQARLDVNGDLIVRGAIQGDFTESPPGHLFAPLSKVIKDQKAAVMQGVGFSATNAPNLYPPHQFVIGYIGDGKQTNSARVLDLTTGAWSTFKTFIIDHPQREGHYLVHATLEGPEGAVFYRGTAQLEQGQARIQLPDYFEALTRPDGRTILLTNLDGFDQLAVQLQDGAKIKDGAFIVVSANPESTQAFDWEVKAARSDVAPLAVEPARRDLRVESFGPYAYGIPSNGRGERQ
jgi:hypothetical protein